MKLGVEFLKRDFTSPLTFPDVELKPERYSWHRWGGPELATVQAYGGAVALWQMVNWLRAPVTIRDERGKAVWWGYIAEVTVGVGSMQLGLTLQGMANRIKVFYPDQADGSPSEELETDWAEDADSISTYGTFELVAKLTGTSATLEMANAYRDQLLEVLKYPRPVMRHGGQGGSELKATIRCRGWWFSLAWEHYANQATEDAETTAQIATIAGQGQFISGTDVPDQSGVYTSQFRDGTEPMLAIVELMLASGMEGGNQLAATVTADRLVRVFEEPSADELYLLPDGRVADVYGNPLMNHECPVAKWCVLRDVIPPTVIVSRVADVGRFFVERAEYTVADGKLVLEPRGQAAAWSALRISAAAGGGGGAGFVGRFEGPHAGLFRFPNDDGTWSVLMQVADTANVPFLSAGARNFKSNSRWLRIGYEDKAHIYLEAPTDGAEDPEEHTDLVMPSLALESGAADDGDVLTADGAGGVAWELPAGGTGFANPTASVGLTVVNGVAETAMRSDAAPPLDQGIVPTWTGKHTFTGTPAVEIAVASGDPVVIFDIGGTDEWTIGVDDGGQDPFKINPGANLATNSLFELYQGTLILQQAQTWDLYLSIDQYHSGTARSILNFRKADSDVIGTQTETDSGDVLGEIQWDGCHSSNAWGLAAFMSVLQDAASGNTYVPARMEFKTSDGTAAPAIRMTVKSSGRIFVGSGSSPSGLLHVAQESASGSIPVLYLDQADVSEEMIEFNTTIGTGNAIEAVGAKTLTPTHFIKVTLPGGLTRYLEVGTIP